MIDQTFLSPSIKPFFIPNRSLLYIQTRKAGQEFKEISMEAGSAIFLILSIKAAKTYGQASRVKIHSTLKAPDRKSKCNVT